MTNEDKKETKGKRTLTRILLQDGNGQWRKIAGVASDAKEPNVYFFLPSQFKVLTGSGKVKFPDLLKEDKELDGLVSFDEVHLRYPADGKVHLILKDSKKRAVLDTYIEELHEPLSSLTPGKLIFTIIPKNISSYPPYEGKEEDFAWKIKHEQIPNYYKNQPVFLNFWIGVGKEEDLASKQAGIRKIEMEDTLHEAWVGSGQDGHIQLFLSVTKPQGLQDFPESMILYLHPPSSPRLKKVDPNPSILSKSGSN